MSWRDWNKRSDGRYLLKQNGVHERPFEEGHEFCDHEVILRKHSPQTFHTVPCDNY